MRFLCLSDIHGHADALSAVLATAERTGYTRVLVAGDICFPGPAPLSTWRRLNQLQARCVQGVGDRAIATVDTSTFRPRDDFERARLRRLVDVRRELGDAQRGRRGVTGDEQREIERALRESAEDRRLSRNSAAEGIDAGNGGRPRRNRQPGQTVTG